MRIRRLTEAEVVRDYGDPSPYIDNGKATSAWEFKILADVVLPAPLPLTWLRNAKVSHLRCHKDIVLNVDAALREIHAKGLWAHIKGFGGCYNFRSIRGTNKLSMHAWGLALDFDFVDYIAPAWLKWIEPYVQQPKPPMAIVEIFAKHGFYWGGLFTNKDPMHFEIGRTTL